MESFNGWNLEDFEAFLSKDTNLDKMRRLEVKEKLDLYVRELFDALSLDEYFKHHKKTEGGKFANKENSIWGAICKLPYKSVVEKPHLGFYLDSDNFMIGVQIEGKTPSIKAFDLMKNDKEKFVEMFRKLDGFTFYMWERKHVQASFYNEFPKLKLQLNDKIARSDIESLLSESAQYKLFIFRVAKTFKHDDKELISRTFLDKSIETIDRLKEFYDFVSV